MKLWALDGRETSGLYRVSDFEKKWVIAHVENLMDAKLIAAAPELLTHAKEVRRLLGINIDLNDPSLRVRLMKLLETTINKAEGKSNHICGLECEKRCCDIDGHEFEEGACIHCNDEEPNFDQIAFEEEQDSAAGEERYERSRDNE